jgi:hypothetical protein
MNQANQATNEFGTQLFDPMRQAQISMQAAQLGDPNNRMGIPNMMGNVAMNTMGRDASMNQPSGPTFGEQVLGIASSAIPKLF